MRWLRAVAPAALLTILLFCSGAFVVLSGIGNGGWAGRIDLDYTTPSNTTKEPEDKPTQEPTTEPTTEPATGTTDESTTDASTTDASTGSGSTDTGVTECTPILVEILYDLTGSDDGFEWIKLYNPCAADIDLSGYAVGWGTADYTAGVSDLQGVLPGGGCFVVGGPESVVANANPVFDMVLDFEPNVPNGGADGSGVGLFVGPAAGITALSVPIDAVIYGDANNNGLLGPDGIPIPPHVADAGDGGSNRRTALDPLWVVELVPTPNVCPPF